MSKTILIVEDYADVRAVMKLLVQRLGYEVIEAADGNEAITQASELKPDLILMDLSMPLMDGLTATQIIRSMNEFDNIPILALTAYSGSMHRRAITSGCDDVLQKPLDADKLKLILDRYLK